MQADGIAFWGYLASTGKLVSQATFKPYTSSTDGWVTVENQTPGGVNPTRLAWNAWLRDGAPLIAGAAAATGTTDPAAVRVGSAGHPLDAVLEVADALESSRDSGVWTPGYTSDGLHPNPTGHAAAAAGFLGQAPLGGAGVLLVPRVEGRGHDGLEQRRHQRDQQHQREDEQKVVEARENVLDAEQEVVGFRALAQQQQTSK